MFHGQKSLLLGVGRDGNQPLRQLMIDRTPLMGIMLCHSQNTVFMGLVGGVVMNSIAIVDQGFLGLLLRES